MMKQRLDISNVTVTQMVLEASLSCVCSWGGTLSSITHFVYVSSSEERFLVGDLYHARARAMPRCSPHHARLHGLLGRRGGASRR